MPLPLLRPAAGAVCTTFAAISLWLWVRSYCCCWLSLFHWNYHAGNAVHFPCSWQCQQLECCRRYPPRSLTTDKLVQFQCFLHKCASFACPGASRAAVVLTRSLVRLFARSLVRSLARLFMLLCECTLYRGAFTKSISSVCVRALVYMFAYICMRASLLVLLPAACFLSAGQFICDFSMADWGTRRSCNRVERKTIRKEFDVNFWSRSCSSARNSKVSKQTTNNIHSNNIAI